jgi:hypothetical protein
VADMDSILDLDSIETNFVPHIFEAIKLGIAGKGPSDTSATSKCDFF